MLASAIVSIDVSFSLAGLLDRSAPRWLVYVKLADLTAQTAKKCRGCSISCQPPFSV